MLKASTVLPAIVGMGFVFASGAAQAWIANFPDCNGHDVKWRNTLEVSRNKCSIPDSGDLNEAYWNGVLQWDNLTSEVDSFLVRPADDCSVAIGDGKNEVAIVDPSVIPGLNGDTRTIIGACFIGNNSIDESDVAVSSALPFGNPTPISVENEGRGTFVHEFGHFFGFDDENNGRGAMHQTPRPYTGGDATASVFPTDTMGISSYYGLNSQAPNLIPSAMGINNGGIFLLESGTVRACRGSSQTIRFYIGNAGVNDSLNGTNRIYLSTSSSTTTVVGTSVRSEVQSIDGFTEWVDSYTFTVPSTLAYGTYHVHLVMDVLGVSAEVRENDNHTRSGRKLLVDCG